jgi:hypothetical protein
VSKARPVNYDYFGGQDKFGEMVSQSKLRTGDTKAKN